MMVPFRILRLLLLLYAQDCSDERAYSSVSVSVLRPVCLNPCFDAGPPLFKRGIKGDLILDRDECMANPPRRAPRAPFEKGGVSTEGRRLDSSNA